MEFETNTPSADDFARLQASSKRITLEPVSTSVVPEPATGAELSAKLSETANQPNVTSDSEDTSDQYDRYRQAAAEPIAHDHPKGRVVVASTMIACLFVAAFIWMAAQ